MPKFIPCKVEGCKCDRTYSGYCRQHRHKNPKRIMSVGGYRKRAVPWDDRYLELDWVRGRYDGNPDLQAWWMTVPFYLRSKARREIQNTVCAFSGQLVI